MSDTPRVLIVDDHKGARITLEWILADAGYASETAASGTEAVQKATDQEFDAALVDISLPDMAGTEVLSRLKGLHPDCVVIMVTGHASLESAVSALNQGAARYVLKPIDADELLLMLGAALQTQRLIMENRQMLTKLSLLYAIGTALSQSLDMRTALGDTLEIVLEKLSAHTGVIWVSEDHSGKWALVAQRGVPGGLAAEHAIPATADGTDLSAAQVGTPLRVRANTRAPAASGAEPDELQLKCVPLRHAGGTKGVMAISGLSSDHLGMEGVELLEAIGAQIGVAIQNMQLFSQLECAHRGLQQAQAQLIQSEKLTALSQLVAGVAHELNNPLTVVLAFAQHLATTSADQTAREAAERIYQQAERCGQILEHLLTFAREHPPQWALVNVNEVVRAALDLFAYKLRVHDIAVDLQLDPDMPSTGADPHKLQQVFVNIITNAYQSIAASPGQAGRLAIQTAHRGDKLQVVFADNGPGIRAECLSRIFDPFFSTKETGKGTGLGLSVSYGIIREHGGDISASSEPGQGATFTVELPIRPAPEPQPEAPGDMDLSCCQGKRVLVVDAEEAVAEVVSTVLAAGGGLVDVVTDGLEGKQRALSGDYDLVITDLRMPKMNGQRLYEQLLAQNPEVAERVVFCTGDTMDESTTRFLAESGRPVMRKPFGVEQLATVIAKALSP